MYHVKARLAARVFEFLAADKMSVLIFYVVIPCALTDKYQRFGGIYCFHLQGQRWRHGKLEDQHRLGKTKFVLRILLLAVTDAVVGWNDTKCELR